MVKVPSDADPRERLAALRVPSHRRRATKSAAAAWPGPVVAAAVVLDPERYIPGIHDSKMVTALERERLYGVITRKALAWSVASAQPAEIDDINIHRASLEAMRRRRLARSRRCRTSCWSTRSAFRTCSCAQRGVLHGDQPLHRDCGGVDRGQGDARSRDAASHHAEDPRYGYDRHKGYATADHLAAGRAAQVLAAASALLQAAIPV